MSFRFDAKNQLHTIMSNRKRHYIWTDLQLYCKYLRNGHGVCACREKDIHDTAVNDVSTAVFLCIYLDFEQDFLQGPDG